MNNKTKKKLQWIDGIVYQIDEAGNETPYNFDEDVFDQHIITSAPQDTPLPEPPPPATDDEDNGHRALSETFFRTLPDMLRIPCTRFEDGAERELFVVGAIGIISGMLPNYKGNYFGSV